VLARGGTEWNLNLPLLPRNDRRKSAIQSTNLYVPAAAVFASSFAISGAVPDAGTGFVKRAKAGLGKIDDLHLGLDHEKLAERLRASAFRSLR
jgi:hypothetical protein